MIKRIWRGWASVDNADEYEQLLNTTVQFVTIMTFDGWDAVREFAGGDGHGSVVPPQAQALLSRFDQHSAHFDVAGDHPAHGIDRGEREPTP